MQSQNSCHTFLLLISLALFLHAPPSSANAPASSPLDSTNVDFIRETCSVTLYPDVCLASLSRYATAIGFSPSDLARAAVSVSLSETRLVSAYFSNISASSNSDGCRGALRDCSSMLSCAASQIRDSFKQMCQLSANGGPREIRFQISNVQTWMSAALTNEDTCTDGFSSLPEGPVKSDVCDHVAGVRKFTSNALALVNFYASTVG